MKIELKDLKIVKLSKVKFYSTDKKMYCKPTGYAIKHNILGFLSFHDDNTKDLVKTPYTPCGGKKALQSILDGRGLTDYNNVEWLQAEL